MSRSTHQFEIKGVDKSGGAFESIKGKAAATSAQIRSMVGGAIAAAGAYMGFQAIKGGVDELGHLSDIAQKTSTDVGELTGAVQAMGILGIQNMGVEQLGKAFDYMSKTVGRSGMEGFYQTLEELGQISDVAKRGQEAMRIFGRSGMEFMPLINAADQGTDALRGVVEAMPQISQAAADSGDAVSDSMSMATGYLKQFWLEAIGSVCNILDEGFTGGVREAVVTAAAYFEYFVKKVWRQMVTFGTNCGLVAQNFFDNWREVLSATGDAFGAFFSTMKERGFFQVLKDMWNTSWEDWANGDFFGKDFAKQQEAALDSLNVGDRLNLSLGLDTLITTDTDDLEETLKKKLDSARKLQTSYNEAAISTAKRNQRQMSKFQETQKQTKISNELIMGGSNAALRLQLLGPTLQTESKKQTNLLTKIAANTEKTADNTEEMTSSDELGVID